MPTFERFALPDAGEGLTEAEIVQWHVAVGHHISVNQVLVEIETAKSLVELPAPWAGVVTELLAAEGDTVAVGTPIVVIDTDPNGPPQPDGAAGSTAKPHGTPDDAREATKSGDGAVEASDEVGAVLVGYGPAHMDHAATPRATPLGTHPAPSTGGAAPATHDLSDPVSGAATAVPPSVAAPDTSEGATTHVPVLAKPPVRKLAKDLGVDLTTVRATGPGGIITGEDVLARAQEADPKNLATYPGDDQPWLASGTVSNDGRQTRVAIRSVRKRTAEAMVTSAFTAPHVTVFHTVDVTRTVKLVEALRLDREFEGIKVTPLAVAARALTLAVRRHPEINASWDELSQEIVYKHYINLGVAVATPRGLMVPNIKDAHRMSLRELAVAIGALAGEARQGKTAPPDLRDGTITVTNVGVFGIDTGTPILNPGEAGILAFGAIRQQPWVHKGKIRKRWVTQLALSFDHRLVDGELGSRVLASVARVLEDPARGLVWA